MIGANGAVKDVLLLVKEANALQTFSVRCTMDSARSMTGSDRYTTSIVRGRTDITARVTCSVALMKDPMRHMMSPDRHLTDTMRSARDPVRAVTRPRQSTTRATGPMMDTMRLRPAAIAGTMRPIGAVTPPIE